MVRTEITQELSMRAVPLAPRPSRNALRAHPMMHDFMNRAHMGFRNAAAECFFEPDSSLRGYNSPAGRSQGRKTQSQTPCIRTPLRSRLRDAVDQENGHRFTGF